MNEEQAEKLMEMAYNVGQEELMSLDELKQAWRQTQPEGEEA